MARKLTQKTGDLVVDKVVERVVFKSPDPLVDWSKLDKWPHVADSFALGLECLTYLWQQPRAYSVQDLTLLSQTRFELSRRRAIPGQYYRMVKQLAKRWGDRERLLSQAKSGGYGGMPGAPHFAPLPHPLPVAPLPAADLVDWRAVLPQ